MLMRNMSRGLLCLALCVVSAPALARMGGFAPRPAVGVMPFPHVRPHPPGFVRAPERGVWRRNYPNAYLSGFGGPWGYGYAPAEPTAPASPPPVVENPRQRTVVYNYNGPPPLAQGDAGYVAQPAIYDVDQILKARAHKRRVR
jgi:hypothetical protein